MSFFIDSYLSKISCPFALLQLPKQQRFFIRLYRRKNVEIPPTDLAEQILKPEEIDIWFTQSWPNSRKWQWLLGRLAAKEAVCCYLQEQYQQKAGYKEISILPDQYGRPNIAGKGIQNFDKHLCLSISHSGITSAALVVEESRGKIGAGIDIEFMDRSHEGLEEGGFSASERNMLTHIPQTNRRAWLLRAWCAKEALAKALGRGLLGNPFNILVKKIDFDSGEVRLRLAGQLAKVLSSYSGITFSTHTGKWGNLVFAVSGL